MSDLQQCEKILDLIESTKLRFGLKDSSLLLKTCVFSDIFLRLSDLERCKLVSNTGDKAKKNLIILTAFLAEEAVNKADASFIKAGLVAHVFEGCEEDYRENIRHLVLLNYAALQLGHTLKNIYDQLNLNFKSIGIKKLEAFLNRDSTLNVLESYDIKAVHEDEKIKFVPASC